MNATLESTLTKQQYKNFGPRPIAGFAKGAAIWANVRYDDECGNGHNTFAITGHVTEPGKRDWACGGCIHEEIAAAFPELAPLIKWHMCSSDGPMYYVANTVYFAGDKDHNGQRKGEPSRYSYGVRFGDSPVTHVLRSKSFFHFLQERKGEFQVVAIAHPPTKDTYKYADNWTFVGYGDQWHECPFSSEVEAREFAEGMNRCKVEFVQLPTAFSEGKERELDAARRAAIWPDATDEDLTAPGLKTRLEDRLPALLAEFRAAVESLGFTY